MRVQVKPSGEQDWVLLSEDEVKTLFGRVPHIEEQLENGEIIEPFLLTGGHLRAILDDESEPERRKAARAVEDRQKEIMSLTSLIGSSIEVANKRGILKEVLETLAEMADTSDLNMDLQENGARVHSNISHVPGAQVFCVTVSAT